MSEKRDERINELHAMLNTSVLSSINQSYAHFSLFNEYDAINNIDSAFEHLKNANDVRRTTVDYQPVRQKEFYENKLGEDEKFPIEKGQYTKYQKTEAVDLAQISLGETDFTIEKF